MFCGFYLTLHTLGSYDIFSSVGIWVFDVKTRIYCQGVKKFKQNTEKWLPKWRVKRYFCEISGMTASCMRDDEVLVAGYLDCDGARKWFTKKIPKKKWVCESKDVGFIKNPHLSEVCPQNGISGIRRYKPSFQNLNRRANARRKTLENDILVTGCIYK